MTGARLAVALGAAWTLHLLRPPLSLASTSRCASDGRERGGGARPARPGLRRVPGSTADTVGTLRTTTAPADKGHTVAAAMNDWGTAHALYQRLLPCYPHKFREQFGESMEQPFTDLYREQKRVTQPALLGLLLWVFVETAISIVRERILPWAGLQQGGIQQ